MIEDRRRDGPERKCVHDTASATIPDSGGGRGGAVVKGAEVEQDGKGEDEDEDKGAQVGQASWGAEELGEGARVVAEDVSASLEGDWSGQHSAMRCEGPGPFLRCFPPCLTSRVDKFRKN